MPGHSCRAEPQQQQPEASKKACNVHTSKYGMVEAGKFQILFTNRFPHAAKVQVAYMNLKSKSQRN